jgi:molybdopterin-containing oxidoreductase family iron-sulfur binding subunit
MTKAPLDLAAIQAHLAASQGRDFWRSLEELAQTETFQEFLHREFPRQASEWLPSMNRRQFLKLMGASLALAGLAACSNRPPEKIIPYVEAPEGITPGQSLFFATAMSLGGYGLGLLAQSQMNRPTKLEGNPDHPASRGATDAFAQASILTLYDPDRATEITLEGEVSSWDVFVSDLQSQLAQQRETNGAGLCLLTETVTSPTLFAQIQALLAEYPAAVWRQYEPVNRDNVYAGAALAFGEAVESIYRFDNANVIVSLDADFLFASPGRVRYARDFADGRRVGAPEGRTRNRLYVVESTPTITGGAADHRLPLKAGQIEMFARALALELGVSVGESGRAQRAPASGRAPTADAPEGQTFPTAWISAVARDLQANPGAGLILAGDHQPPIVHALAHAMNETLGNAGQTVIYSDPVVSNPENQTESLHQLVDAMAAGQVEMLLILGGNPVFTAPADLDFAAALEQVDFRVHLGTYVDETATRCHWQIPESHYLETWGDVRAYDGTVTIQQPLIEPLYHSRSAYELLDLLLSAEPRSGHDIVQAYWSAHHGEEGFAAFWQTSLHDGFVAGSALPARSVTVLPEAAIQPPEAPATEGLEINFRPDPTLWDGRYANNGWLQELPKPLTKLTWENAALINPQTAGSLGLAHEDLVELSYNGQTVQAPLWLMPGHPEGAVTVYLGYGRTHAGNVGDGAGFNAFALRTAGAPWFGAGLNIRKTGTGHRFASTQNHHSMEGRNLVRVGTAAQFASEPNFVQEMNPHTPEISLYPKFDYTGNSWGMAIDLSACIGCNACVTACQAENNIPIVGKEEVANGREMHWIRLDHYYQGEDLANPAMHHQPVLCMHCENAPCEVVCPVAATMHDQEGLNTMVYNRCIGTRYCSNNCPYKVRRFNFLEYTDFEAESLKLQRNPNVTVRARGVMEKCTYCVQRISAARVTAKLEGRGIADGEVVTACQAACPTQAIVFGNLNDPQSQVVQRKASPLNYGLLTELNTQPRTTYLAKLRNPNPELEG